MKALLAAAAAVAALLMLGGDGKIDFAAKTQVTARALAEDLPLFAVPSRAAAEAALPSEAQQLIEAIKALHPDEMSPREALETLYALKAKLPK